MVCRNSNLFIPQYYLKQEKLSLSPIKYEYIKGQVYPIPATNYAHDIIALNLAFLLRNHLLASKCSVYGGEMKAHIEASDIYYYPDVMVSCKPTAADDCQRYPHLVVEVMSPDTQAFDRQSKFLNYQAIETLQEYVLISQEHVSIECFRRTSSGNWLVDTYSKGEQVYFTSVNFNCAIADIYDGAIPSCLAN